MVADDCGAVSGITVIIASSPSGLTRGGVVNATPGVASKRRASCVQPAVGQLRRDDERPVRAGAEAALTSS